MLENGVRIPSLDGKDIYISNNCINPKLDDKGFRIGYRLRNQNGDLNLQRFINTLDYSLDLIKMQEVYESIYRRSDFSFYKNGKDYTQRAINVTFKYNNKAFNRVRENVYVKFGYLYEDLQFVDHVALVDGEVVGIEVDVDVENPIPNEVLDKCFYFDNGTYKAKDNIPILNSVANIREELYQNGFYCDGIKYVRFKRSAGSSRVGKCLFIDERLYRQMHKWEMCGIKVKDGQDVDLAALEPYIALTLSSIIDTIQLRPENILVVDDYKSVFNDRAIATRLVDGRLVSRPEDVEISNSIWDGQSLMDRSVFLKFQEHQRRTNPSAREHGMLLLRARFFKSCCFNANIQQWFADNGIVSVDQLNGETKAQRIEDIKLITTPSSIKFLKFGSLDMWLDTLEPTFGVVKHEKPTHFFDGRMVQTHYQLLNTLQMTYEEVGELVKPSIEFARLIKNDPAALRFQISYAYHSPDKMFYTESIASKNDIVYRLLGLNDKFSKTHMYRGFCNDLVKSYIKNLRCGHILVHGNYSTICGNPIEMLKQAIGKFDGSSVIEANTVHSTKFADGKELLGSRSPHVTMGNVLVTRNVIRTEISRYMNPTNEIVYINSIRENILERLSGADFDSDTVMLTDNQILVKAAKRNYKHFPVPTKLVESTQRQRKYTDSEKADLDIKTSINKIGEIINLSQELNSILWDRLYHGATIDDVMELYCDIAQLDVMSNLEIDSAKRENPANNTYELQCLKKKYDIRDKKNRHIRPLFFKYIDGYKGYRDDYYLYSEIDGEYVKVGRTEKLKDARDKIEANKKDRTDVEIHIERGRMSYRKHETSMDYLQKHINKFSMPRISTESLDYVLTKDKDGVEGRYCIRHEQQIVEVIKSLKDKTTAIWDNSDLTNREKRERAAEIREQAIRDLQEINISDKTMYYILKHMEDEHKSIARYMFFFLLDIKNYVMREKVLNVLQDSSEPIDELVEDENGSIQIYDYHYRKEKIYMPYDDQDTFREYVINFMREYGIQSNWFAVHIKYAPENFSKFINGKKNMSKSKRIEVYRKIVEYQDRLSGF